MDRASLLQILDAGLGAADGRRCVREFLVSQRPVGPLHLIAVGKAAAAMSLGALDVLGADVVDGYVVTRTGYGDPELASMPGIRLVQSSHPVPDRLSLEAGEGLLAYAAAVKPGSGVIALVSGGASSLVEALPEGVDACELDRINRWLLGSGLDIFGVNAVRRRLSRIKDGRLAAALGGHPVFALYLSDVMGDDPAWIGSGLFQRTEVSLPEELPDWIAGIVHAGTPPPAPAAHVEHHVVGNLACVLDACERSARSMGLEVTRHGQWLEGPVQEAAAQVVNQLDAGPAGIHLWGGETTMILPADSGRGGRNQHFALCCAVSIEGRDDLAILCSATDGTDGSGEDAGGLVDGGTIQRGRDGGADPVTCLARADSGTFLEASGDLIYTGPTSTNVNDVVIGFKR